MCFAFTQCLQVLPPSPWVEGRREACGPTVCSTAQGQVSSAKLPPIPHGDGARSAAQAWLPAALVLGEYSKLPAGEVQQPAVEAAPSGQGATSLMEPHAVGWPMLQVQGGTLAQGTPRHMATDWAAALPARAGRLTVGGAASFGRRVHLVGVRGTARLQPPFPLFFLFLIVHSAST